MFEHDAVAWLSRPLRHLAALSHLCVAFFKREALALGHCLAKSIYEPMFRQVQAT